MICKYNRFYQDCKCLRSWGPVGVTKKPSEISSEGFFIYSGQEPVDGGDDMDGFSVDLDIPGGGESDEGQVVTVKWTCRLDKG